MLIESCWFQVHRRSLSPSSRHNLSITVSGVVFLILCLKHLGARSSLVLRIVAILKETKEKGQVEMLRKCPFVLFGLIILFQFLCNSNRNFFITINFRLLVTRMKSV